MFSFYTVKTVFTYTYMRWLSSAYILTPNITHDFLSALKTSDNKIYDLLKSPAIRTLINLNSEPISIFTSELKIVEDNYFFRERRATGLEHEVPISANKRPVFLAVVIERYS